MGKYIRILTAIVLVLGLAIVARNKAAWAASLASGTDQSALAQAEQSVSLGKDDDCKKDKNKNKNKCDGTVKPPDDDIDVCKRGNYSVGGAATLDVKKLKDRDCLRAHTRLANPAVDQIPNGAGTIVSDALLLELPASGGKVKICFAVPPGKQVKIYSSGQGLKTTVRNGIACAEVSSSGTYTLVGQ